MPHHRSTARIFTRWFVVVATCFLVGIPAAPAQTSTETLPAASRSASSLVRDKTPLFATQKVVFYAQHQDDETLWAAGAIRNVVRFQGSKNVYVVLVGSGTGLKFFHKPNAIQNIVSSTNFSALTPARQFDIRTSEFDRAVKALGVPSSNIVHIASRIGLNKKPFAEQRRIALSFERKGDVTHVAHAWALDSHLAHRSNGRTIHALAHKGRIAHAFYFVKPEFAKRSSLCFPYISSRGSDRRAIARAINCYGDDGYNVGWLSSPRAFERLSNDPHYTVYLQRDSEEAH